MHGETKKEPRLTIREHLIGQALSGLAAHGVDDADIPRRAVALADAVIERIRQHKEEESASRRSPPG